MTALLDATMTGLAQGCMLALVALGYSLVFGVLRLINFAHGEVFMVGAYTALSTTTALAGVLPPLWALGVGLVVAMAGAAALGVALERFAYRPLRAKAGDSAVARRAPLVTALAASVLLQNAAQLVFSARYRPFPAVVEAPRPLIMAVTVAVAVALEVGLRRTYFGLALRAVAFDPDAARLVGVPVHKVVAATFGLGSALAALGAVLYCLDQSQVYPTLGVGVGMRAFVAAVVGGIGSIPGAFLGGLLLGLLGELLKLTSYSGGLDAVVFLVLIATLVGRPEGLLGRREPLKV
mgnify:FL=1